MLPSFTVPRRVRTPWNELRLDQLVVDTPVSKFIDCSICQMNLRPDGAMSRSPRKPMYEFCTSTALRAPGDVVVQAVPQVAAAPLTSVETSVLVGCVGSLLVP